MLSRTLGTALVLLALVTSQSPAQTVLPLRARADTSEHFITYGLGDLDLHKGESVSDFAANPAAKLALAFFPRSEVSIFASFDKGAALKETKTDSFSVPALLFPAAGATAFQGQLSVMLPSRVKDALGSLGHALGYASIHDPTTKWEIGPFWEFAWETFNLRKDTTHFDLAARWFALGLRHTYYWYPAASDSGGDRYSFGTGVSYLGLKVPDGSVNALRSVTTDSLTATRYKALRAKFFVQINDLTMEAEYVSASRQGQHAYHPAPGINGEHFVVRFVAAGKFVGK